MQLSNSIRPGLVILGVLHLVMLSALYTQTVPHPPLRMTPFALGPYLGAMLAVIAAALAAAEDRRLMRVLIPAVILLSLVSFGPQKYVDPAFPQIWPAVLTAQAAIVSLGVAMVRMMRRAGTGVSR